MAAPEDRLPFDLNLRFARSDAGPDDPSAWHEAPPLALLDWVLSEFEPDFRRDPGRPPHPSFTSPHDRWVHEAAWNIAPWPHGLNRTQPVAVLPASRLWAVTCPLGREVPLRFADLAGAFDDHPAPSAADGHAPASPDMDRSSWVHHLRVGHIAGIRPHRPDASVPHPEDRARRVPALLLDLSLYAAQHARALIGLGIPALILLPVPLDPPKARLLHDLLTFLEDQTGIAYGELRVLLPLSPGSSDVELDAALFHLRDRVCGVIDEAAGQAEDPTQAIPSQARNRTLARRGATRLTLAP